MDAVQNREEVRVSDYVDPREFKRDFQRGSKNKKRKEKNWDSFRRNKRETMFF